MTIPSGVIIPWPNTNASIPGGWTRYTALDGRYPKHLATISNNPGVTGGSATHTHTSTAHAHTQTHTHTATSSNENNDAPTGWFASSLGTSANDMPQTPHQHAMTLAAATITTGLTTVVWNATASDPPYYAMIWIQSDGTPTGVPPNACVLWNTQTVPANWIQHVASKGRYLRGAAAGADGGITGGSTHNHTSATAHGHAALLGHAHGGTSDPHGTPAWTNLQSGASQLPPNAHAHAISDGSTPTAAFDNTTSPATGATAIGIPYVYLAVLQNSQSTNQQPVGMIALWTGTLATMPGGWTQVTSIPTDRFIKAASVLTTVGQKAGALGHGHVGGAGHVHSQNIAGHAHGVTLGANATNWLGNLVASGGTVNPPPVANHAHAVSITSAVDRTGSAAAVADVAAVADDRPLYTEVAFIQFGGPMTVAITAPAGGAVLGTSTPTVAWALASGYTQNDYRLFVYAADGVTVVYDSNRQTSPATSATVPSGYLVSGQTYVLQVVVNDTQGDNAVSAPVTVSTSWSSVPSIATISTSPVGGT